MNTTNKEHQLNVLWHTLGLDKENPEQKPSRNLFVAGQGHPEQPVVDELVALGWMVKVRTPAFLDPEDQVFIATENGRDVAICELPPVPKQEGNYRAFLNADCGNSFADFLGIRLPQEQYENGLYRYCRKAVYWKIGDRDVVGQWASTKAAAKESYKDALKEFRAQQRHNAALERQREVEHYA